MKRNLLTLMFVLSLVFFGMLVSNVEASNNAKTTILKNQTLYSKINRSKSKSAFINFNENFAKLKRECAKNRYNPCDAAIENANFWARIGLDVCANGDGFICQVVQTIALDSLNIVIAACSQFPPTTINASQITPKNKYYSTIDRPVLPMKTEAGG